MDNSPTITEENVRVVVRVRPLANGDSLPIPGINSCLDISPNGQTVVVYPPSVDGPLGNRNDGRASHRQSSQAPSTPLKSPASKKVSVPPLQLKSPRGASMAEIPSAPKSPRASSSSNAPGSSSHSHNQRKVFQVFALFSLHLHFVSIKEYMFSSFFLNHPN